MTLKIIVNFRFTQTYRVAEVVRRYEGSSTKSSYLYENCRDNKICCDLPTFWKSLGNKVPFGSNTVFLRQEVNYYMVYIAYYTELNLQICNYAKKQRICCTIVNTRLPKICMAIFALAERLPTSATLFKF